MDQQFILNKFQNFVSSSLNTQYLNFVAHGLHEPELYWVDNWLPFFAGLVEETNHIYKLHQSSVSDAKLLARRLQVIAEKGLEDFRKMTKPQPSVPC